MTVSGSRTSEKVILMSSLRSILATFVMPVCGATDSVTVRFDLLSLLIVTFEIVEFETVTLSKVEFETVELLMVELSIVELSIVE